MKIRYKKLNESAVEPYKKYKVDAGFDLTATWIKIYDDYIEYGTDIAFEIPEGYVGLLFPRSSVRDQDLMLKNSVGVIDASYRGEISFCFYGTDIVRHKLGLYNHTDYGDKIYNVGERCGQIVIIKIPDIEMIESDELSDTDRGTEGYGKSGN